MRKILLASVAALAMASSARASGVIDSGFGASFDGLAQANWGAIAVTPFVFAPLNAPGGVVKSDAEGYGDLAGLLAGAKFQLSPFTLQNGSSFSFSTALGSFSGTTTLLPFSCAANSTVCSVAALVAGTFTPLVGAPIAGASVSFGASQARSSDAALNDRRPLVSVSTQFTFAMSRADQDGGGDSDVGVPVPAALGLFGLGLFGLALTRRRGA